MTDGCPHEYSRFGLSACYACLKWRALNGGKGTLTPEERAYVGVSGDHRIGARGGRRQGGWR